MYDALVRSTIFGLRNADKVINTDDKGRILADVGQLTNAAKSAAQLDNAVGKGAQAAIEAMGSLSQKHKALEIAGKGVTWASEHVNPLLICAAGYRVATADDKETALKREVFGMSAMFGAEHLIRSGFASGKFQNFKGTIKNKYALAICGIIEGLLFVGCSIAGSTLGYKLGKYFYPDKVKDKGIKLNHAEVKANVNKIAENNLISKTETVNNNLKAEKIDESEYFSFKKDGKTLA